METWQLQHAKNKFSELVDHAMLGEPQLITRHGEPVAILSSVEDYNRGRAPAKPEKNFVDFLLSMPKMPDEWFENGEDPFPRINGTLRDVDF